jgi:SNF2 family DNA or RNA helicase
MSGRQFSFDKFALQTKTVAAGKSSLSATSSSSSANQKKTIQCSDDEYESEVEVVKEAPRCPSNDVSDDGWEESRNGDKMSTKEKTLNIKRAQEERNPGKIAKRPRIADDDDDDDDDDSKDENVEVYRKIDYSIKSSSALDSSLLEDTPEPKAKAKDSNLDRDEILRKERDYRSSKRSTDQGSAEFIDQKVKPKAEIVKDLTQDDDDNEAEAGDTDDSDNEDNGRGWNDSDNKSDSQEKARAVLRHCEMIGKTLRENLQSWGGGDDAKASSAASKNSNFCTGLMSIRQGKGGDGNGRMDILSDEYFKDICPGLVLKAYQLVGVNWLKLLHENNINGVLADDMGLGKTVQSVAFLGWLKNSRPSSAESTAHLIVVPASTLSNWENELRRFCPSLSVVSYHGTQNERAELRYDLKRDIRAGRVDVVLSTFTIFERESGKDDRSFLYKQNFEYLIVDEAHCLKVSTSARFTNMNAIRAGHRLLLSGTPVQNDLGELLSLMSFTMPKLFRNIDIEEVLEGFGWDKKSGVPSSSSSSVSINQLRGMLAPFVLRRIKSDVLDQLVDKVS